MIPDSKTETTEGAKITELIARLRRDAAQVVFEVHPETEPGIVGRVLSDAADALSALQQRVEEVTEQLSVAREMKSAYLDRAEAAEAVIAVLRKIEADLLATGQQEFEIPRSPNWWTPDRMKAMRYGKSSALVSASLMVKHALASLPSSPVSRPAEPSTFPDHIRPDGTGVWRTPEKGAK